MSREAKSLIGFGVYLTALGFLLIVAPGALPGLFGIPSGKEIWLRVCGTLVVIIGYFCIQAGRFDWREFYVGSIVTRFWVMGCFSAYVLLGLAPRPLLILGTLDFLGALWTWAALARRGEHFRVQSPRYAVRNRLSSPRRGRS